MGQGTVPLPQEMSRIAQTLGKCQDLKTPHHEFCLILAGGLEAGLSKPKCMIQPEHLPGQPFLLHTANAPPTPPTPSRAGDLQTSRSEARLGGHESPPISLSLCLSQWGQFCAFLWREKDSIFNPAKSEK